MPLPVTSLGRTSQRSILVLLPWLVLLVFGTMQPGSIMAVEPTVVTLALNGLELGIDQGTGSIVRLACPATGAILEGAPASAGLLDVAYPVEAFMPMRLASRFSRANFVKDAKALTIRWDRLSPSRTHVPLPEGRVSAQVTIQQATDGRSVIMTCRIENHSDAQIPQVLFPDLWGLKPIHDAQGTQLRLSNDIVFPFAGPVKPSDAVTFVSQRG